MDLVQTPCGCSEEVTLDFEAGRTVSYYSRYPSLFGQAESAKVRLSQYRESSEPSDFLHQVQRLVGKIQNSDPSTVEHKM